MFDAELEELFLVLELVAALPVDSHVAHIDAAGICLAFWLANFYHFQKEVKAFDRG